MEVVTLEKELNSLAYHGRGIVIGKSADGTKAVIAYFIMGRSENSRNRIFVEDGEGISGSVPSAHAMPGGRGRFHDGLRRAVPWPRP